MAEAASGIWQTLKSVLVPGLDAKPVQNAIAISGVTSSSAAWSSFTGQTGDGGMAAVTPVNASSVTAIHACTSLIAGCISALNLNSYDRKPDGERLQLENDDLWWILNEEFNPRWSAAKGWEYLGLSVLLHGDGFAVIERMGARIIGLRPVHPQMVEVCPSDDGRRLLYRVTSDWRDGSGAMGQRVYDQDDIIHIAGIGFDGLRSMSPLRSFLRMAGSVALATQEYASRFFSQGARPDYVIKGDMTAEQIEQTRAAINAYHSGLNNSRRPMLLTGGLELQTISLPLEDVQLLSLRQFQVEEIARAYLVPPFMIGHTTNTTSWGSGVEAMGKGFVRYCLRAYLHAIENEFNRKLIRDRNSTKFLAFDTSELEQADTKSLFEAFRIALGRAGEPGFMTPDEVRKRLNLKNMPGGDKLASGGPMEAANAETV